MSFNDIRAFINDSNTSVELFYIKKTKRHEQFTLEAQKVIHRGTDIKDTVVEILDNYLNSQESKPIVDYTIEMNAEYRNCLYRLEVGDILNYNKYETEMSETNYSVGRATLEDLDPNVYSIVFRRGNDKLVFYKSYKPTTLFKSYALLKFLDTRNVQDTAEEAFLSIRKNIDCVYFSVTSEVIIFNRNNFETIFNYKDDYAAKARAVLSELQARHAVQGFDVFARKCINNDFRVKKLAKIGQRGTISVLDNIEQCKILNERRNLQIVFDTSNKIVVDDETSSTIIDNILKLLNDEPAKHELSGREFMAEDTSPVQQQLAL